jgi:predicted GNAT family N-acyltransferase
VVTVRRIRWSDPGDRVAAERLRTRVFVEEQGVPPELERDEHDAIACHVLAEDRGEPVGTGRLIVSGDTGKIGRMAVVAARRGGGIGGRVLAALVSEARALGLARVRLHAQVHAAPFYERHGFVACGDVFVEAGIDHLEMVFELPRLR